MVNRILAVSTGGLGDAILFSPVIKALRNGYPHAEIELLVSSNIVAEAYASAHEINQIITLDLNRSIFPGKILQFLGFILKTQLKGSYDLGVFATGLNPKMSSILTLSGTIKQRSCAISPPKLPTDFLCNLKLAARYDRNISRNDVFIPITEIALKGVDKALREYNLYVGTDTFVAIYPSVNLAHRPRWRLSSMIKAVHHLKKLMPGKKFAVVGSETEGLEWGELDQQGVVDANLAGRLTITESVAFISRCVLALCNDGGLMHVAGAVGCPLVAIMPYTSPTYAPPGDETMIVSSQNYNNISNRYSNQNKAPFTEDISIDEVCRASIRLIGQQESQVEFGFSTKTGIK